MPAKLHQHCFQVKVFPKLFECLNILFFAPTYRCGQVKIKASRERVCPKLEEQDKKTGKKNWLGPGKKASRMVGIFLVYYYWICSSHTNTTWRRKYNMVQKNMVKQLQHVHTNTVVPCSVHIACM